MKISSVRRFQATLAMLAATLVGFMASSARGESADDLIAKNLKAQGGREALVNLKSLERKGDVSVDGTFGQMDGTVAEVVIPWKKAIRSLDLAVFVQKDGYNGKIAWRDGNTGVQEIEGEEANQIKQAADINPFVMIKERETKAEKLDDEKVEDVEYSVVQLTPKERPPLKIFLDKKTDQIARTTVTQNHPQFGMVEIIIELSGYEKFGPVTLPTKSKVTLGELLQIETTFTETKVNGDVDEKSFDKPEAAAAN